MREFLKECAIVYGSIFGIILFLILTLYPIAMGILLMGIIIFTSIQLSKLNVNIP